MKVFWKYFPQCFGYEPLPENKQAYDKLIETIDGCHVEELPATERNTEMEQKISGRLIKCKTSEFVSVVTISITQMLYNKPGEINEMKLTFEDVSYCFTGKKRNMKILLRLVLMVNTAFRLLPLVI